MHFFLIVTFKAFFLFLIFSNFTIVCKGLIFFLYIPNGIYYDSWRCDLISFIHFIKFLDITFLNIIYFPSFSSLLLMILFFFLSYILLQHPMDLGFLSSSLSPSTLFSNFFSLLHLLLSLFFSSSFSSSSSLCFSLDSV